MTQSCQHCAFSDPDRSRIMEETIYRMDERLKGVCEDLVGNGKPGLIRRVGRLERNINLIIGGILLLSALLGFAKAYL